jgi:hypothetical protein
VLWTQYAQDFIPKLKDYLLAQILGPSVDGTFSWEECSLLNFVNNCIYRHKAVQFNYTTYDVLCDQDSCNPRTSADIFCISEDAEDSHPYRYSCIIGVFHVHISTVEPMKSAICTFCGFAGLNWMQNSVGVAYMQGRCLV